jgi:CubicO group peptidase (beta-lactamase class C family)
MLSANTLFAQGFIPIDSINQIIKREVENKHSASIAVGIIDANGKQIFSYGKFKDDSNQLPDGNTLYEIGSITKVFTSLILADMVQKGELNLNDPISKFLPKSVKTPTYNGKEITLLDLATHTSGLPRGPDNLTSNDQYFPFKGYTVDQMYDFLSRYQLTRAIGSKYEYSNFGMGLLGHILSLKADVDYETLVRNRICKPLHMDNTVVTISTQLEPFLASPHSIFNKPIGIYQMGALLGCGALRSNVNDLLTFLSANLGLTQTDLLPAMELSQIVRDSAPNPTMPIPQFVCLGWHFAKVFDTELINHSGETNGSSAFIGFDKKKKVGVVVLSNSVNAIDDIAVHIIENKSQIQPFHYKWTLKDTLL